MITSGRRSRSGLILGGRPVVVWILAVIGVAVVGALGFMALEGWSFYDAIFMAVTTMTTVGYREVHPLGVLGRIWAMVLALAAIGLVFGTVGLAAEMVMADLTSGRRKAERMNRMLARMNGHFIVCGYGRVGSMVADELRAAGIQVVVLDISEESLRRAEDNGYLVVPGDGTTEEVLRRAGVERAKGLVSAIDSDAQNVYVTLTSRSINPDLFIIARAGARNVEDKLIQAGADRAVSPYTMAGQRMVDLALRPAVTEVVDASLAHSVMSYSLEEVAVEPDGPLVGRTVGQLRSQGILILAVLRAPGDYEPNPPDDQSILAGEHLIVSGATDLLHSLAPSGLTSPRSWHRVPAAHVDG